MVLARTTSEPGTRVWDFARPSPGITRRSITPEEEASPIPGRSTPVRVETCSQIGDRLLPGGWRGKVERRDVGAAVSVPYYLWRILYTSGKVPPRFVLRADPDTGEFPSLPDEVRVFREEGKMRLVSSQVDQQVFEAVPEGYLDVEAPTAFDAIEIVKSRPEWKKDFHYLKGYEVWRSYPAVFVPDQVEAAFRACLPVGRSAFNDNEARVVCAVSSFNSIGEEPTREALGDFVDLGYEPFRRAIRRLEDAGVVSCESHGPGRWACEVCRFTGDPVGSRGLVSPYQRGLLDASAFLFRAPSLRSGQDEVLDFLIDSGVPYRSVSRKTGISTKRLAELRRGHVDVSATPFDRWA